MGSDLGQIHHELSQQLRWLHTKWQEYRALYGHSAERVQQLNGAAPLFFGILQRIMFDDVLLHLARLTDRATMGGRQNLSFVRLPPLVDSKIQRKVERGVDRVLKAAEFARDRRNRTIAHCDLPTLRNVHPKRLAHASRRRVDRVLDAMAAVMNEIEGHYEKSEVLYRSPSEPGGSQALLWRLQGSRLSRPSRSRA